MRAGSYEQACPKLRESYREEAGTGTLLLLALCEENTGKLASAWTTYRRAHTEATRDGQTERAERARRRAEALEPRLSRLLVEVPVELAQRPSLAITLDGAPLARSAWNSAQPVDAGEHQVVVSTEGEETWRGSVVFGAGVEQRALRIGEPPRAPVPSSAPAVDAPVAVRAAPAPPQSTAPRRARALPAPRPLANADVATRPLQTLSLVIGGAGLAGLGAGAVFGTNALRLHHESQLDGHCDERTGCDERGSNLNRGARSAAALANGFFIAGGTFLVSGVALYIWDRAQAISSHRPEQASTKRVTLAPAFGVSGSHIELRGKF